MDFEVRISGDCMAPKLNAGAKVTVKSATVYLPGDVVMARRGKRFEAHRFLGYRPSRVGIVALTQADNQTHPDTAIPTRQVIGRVDQKVSVGDRGKAALRYVAALSRWIRRS